MGGIGGTGGGTGSSLTGGGPTGGSAGGGGSSTVTAPPKVTPPKPPLPPAPAPSKPPLSDQLANSVKSTVSQGGQSTQGTFVTNNKIIIRALNGGQVSGKDMVSALQKEGFVVDRQTGSHVILEGPHGQSVSVPVHGNRDIPIGTLNNILKQAGYK